MKSTGEPQPLYGDLGTGEGEARVLPGTWFSPSELRLNFLNFWVYWLYSRRWSSFFLGLPALTCMIYVGYVLTRNHDSGHLRERIRQQYSTRLLTAMDHKDWSMARIACESLQDRYPTDPQYRYYRLLIAEAVGDAKYARHLIEELTRTDRPGYALARMRLAEGLAKEGEIDRAIKQLELAWQEGLRDDELRGQYASTLAMRGEALVRQGNYVAAILDFKRAISLRPDDATYVRLLNRTLRLSENENLGDSND